MSIGLVLVGGQVIAPAVTLPGGPWGLVLAAALAVAVATAALGFRLQRRLRAGKCTGGQSPSMGPVRGLRATLAVALLLLAGAIVVPLMRRPAMREDAAALRCFRGETSLLDERLTMSARMAAATGDGRWEQRDREAEVELGRVLEDFDATLQRLLGIGHSKRPPSSRASQGASADPPSRIAQRPT